MTPEQREHAFAVLELMEFYIMIHYNFHKGIFDENCLTCWQSKTESKLNQIIKELDKKFNSLDH